MTVQETAITTDLDALLAPLDDVARIPTLGEPTAYQRDRAYTLALLAAELTVNPPSLYLLEMIGHYGIDPDAALTIGRALAGATLRISEWIEQV